MKLGVELKQKFVFRVDASDQIGTGHVMRCLTLAEELRKLNAECLFICCKSKGNLIDLINQHNFEVHGLKTSFIGSFHFDNDKSYDSMFKEEKYLININNDAKETSEIIKGNVVNWLIVDHYGIDEQWEKQLRNSCRHLMVIDDLANRRHDCDLLLDQNLRTEAESLYKRLVPEKCKIVVGASKVILRPSFDNQPTRYRDGVIKNILVYFGANDIHNQALNVIKALQNFPQLDGNIVLGTYHPFRDFVYDAKMPNLRVFDTVDMAKAMEQADLAIGVCGIAAWERCAMGLPALICINANNQREDSEHLHKLGAVDCIGESYKIDADAWTAAISRLLDDPIQVTKMVKAAKEVVKGHSKNRKLLLNMLLSLSEDAQNASVEVS